MAYLSQDALEAMGFAALGRNVKISDKASIYEPEKMEIGDHCRIDDFCVVSGKISMGRNVYIGPLCLVAGGSPGIVFEDFTTMAYHAQVFSQSDDYSGATLTNPTVPGAYKAEIKERVVIGRHSIIGAGAIASPGVTLAEGTSVGSMSLVLKDTAPWSIYAGVPAKKIKDRKQDMLALEAAYLKEEG